MHIPIGNYVYLGPDEEPKQVLNVRQTMNPISKKNLTWALRFFTLLCLQRNQENSTYLDSITPYQLCMSFRVGNYVCLGFDDEHKPVRNVDNQSYLVKILNFNYCTQLFTLL